MAAPGRPPRPVSSARLTGGAFGLLRVAPLMGRLPTAAPEDQETVVISFEVWRDRLDRDPGVLGSQLRVGDALSTVIGVFLGSASSHDPRIFTGAVAVYLLIALVATAGPARRAAITRSSPRAPG